MTETFKKSLGLSHPLPNGRKTKLTKPSSFNFTAVFFPLKGYSCPRCRWETAPSDVRAVSQQQLMRVVHDRGFLKS